jgi:hypothetical protein
VVAEHEVIFDLDDALTGIADALQHLDLDKCLAMKPLLVLDHFHRHVALALMVVDLECLPKGTLPQLIDHLVTVRDVVVLDEHEVSPTIALQIYLSLS